MPPVRKKNLLLLIPNLDFGGAQRAFYFMSTELAKRYNVIDCAFNTDTGVAYPTGNPLVTLDVPGGATVLDKVRNFRKRVQKLQEIKRKHQIDVTISQLAGADYVNLLAPAGDKRIVLVQGSRTAPDANITGLNLLVQNKVLVPWLYRRADRIAVVSRDIVTEMTEAFGLPERAVRVLHNCVDLNTVRPQAAEPIEPEVQAVFDRFPILISSGRLAEQKNQAPLLDVLAGLKAAGSDAKCFLLGDGHLRAPLLARAHALGLRTWTTWDAAEGGPALSADFDLYFLGFQSNPFKYLAKADLFVFPSDFEGFSLALIEALGCGLCIASTDCPTGPRELLAPASATPATPLQTAEYGEHGVLLPLLPHQPGETAEVKVWTEALLRLLREKPLRAQYAAQAPARAQDFDLSRYLDKWVEVIEGV